MYAPLITGGVPVTGYLLLPALTRPSQVHSPHDLPPGSHRLRLSEERFLRCKETGESKCILFGLTGTGYFDMTAYTSFREGTMTDYIPTDEDLQPGFASLPKIDG